MKTLLRNFWAVLKMEPMKRLSLLSFVFLASIALSHAQVTAFRAWELAKKEVNDEAKNRLIEIFGPKSDRGVMPREWHVLFYDPYAKQDGRLVKISGDHVVAIEDGYTQLDKFRLAAYKREEIVNTKQMKVDSNKVLDALTRSTPLKKIKLSSLQFRLKKPNKGNEPPVWFVNVYAMSPRSGNEVELGKARISAETGQIFELEIDTKKLE